MTNIKNTNFFILLFYLLTVVISLMSILIYYDLIQDPLVIIKVAKWTLFLTVNAICLQLTPLSFKSHFIKYLKLKHKWYQILLICMVIGFTIRLFIISLQNLPLLFGYPTIKPGIHQPKTYPSNFEMYFSSLFFAPISEEYFFRFIPLSFLSYFLSHSKSIEKLSEPYKKNTINKFVTCSLIIIVNICFALLHGPSFLSFFLYFIPGIIYSIVLLHYSYFGAVITHSATNLLTTKCILKIFNWMCRFL